MAAATADDHHTSSSVWEQHEARSLRLLATMHSHHGSATLIVYTVWNLRELYGFESGACSVDSLALAIRSLE